MGATDEQQDSGKARVDALAEKKTGDDRPTDKIGVLLSTRIDKRPTPRALEIMDATIESESLGVSLADLLKKYSVVVSHQELGINSIFIDLEAGVVIKPESGPDSYNVRKVPGEGVTLLTASVLLREAGRSEKVLPSVLEYGQLDDGRLFTVMEYVQGEVVFEGTASTDLVKAMRSGEDPRQHVLSEDEVVSLFTTAISDIAFLEKHGLFKLNDFKLFDFRLNSTKEWRVIDWGASIYGKEHERSFDERVAGFYKNLGFALIENIQKDANSKSDFYQRIRASVVQKEKRLDFVGLIDISRRFPVDQVDQQMLLRGLTMSSKLNEETRDLYIDFLLHLISGSASHESVQQRAMLLEEILAMPASGLDAQPVVDISARLNHDLQATESQLFKRVPVDHVVIRSGDLRYIFYELFSELSDADNCQFSIELIPATGLGKVGKDGESPAQFYAFRFHADHPLLAEEIILHSNFIEVIDEEAQSSLDKLLTLSQIMNGRIVNFPLQNLKAIRTESAVMAFIGQGISQLGERLSSLDNIRPSVRRRLNSDCDLILRQEQIPPCPDYSKYSLEQIYFEIAELIDFLQIMRDGYTGEDFINQGIEAVIRFQYERMIEMSVSKKHAQNLGALTEAKMRNLTELEKRNYGEKLNNIRQALYERLTTLESLPQFQAETAQAKKIRVWFTERAEELKGFQAYKDSSQVVESDLVQQIVTSDQRVPPLMESDGDVTDHSSVILAATEETPNALRTPFTSEIPNLAELDTSEVKSDYKSQVDLLIETRHSDKESRYKLQKLFLTTTDPVSVRYLVDRVISSRLQQNFVFCCDISQPHPTVVGAYEYLIDQILTIGDWTSIGTLFFKIGDITDISHPPNTVRYCIAKYLEHDKISDLAYSLKKSSSQDFRPNMTAYVVEIFLSSNSLDKLSKIVEAILTEPIYLTNLLVLKYIAHRVLGRDSQEPILPLLPSDFRESMSKFAAFTQNQSRFQTEINRIIRGIDEDLLSRFNLDSQRLETWENGQDHVRDLDFDSVILAGLSRANQALSSFESSHQAGQTPNLVTENDDIFSFREAVKEEEQSLQTQKDKPSFKPGNEITGVLVRLAEPSEKDMEPIADYLVKCDWDTGKRVIDSLFTSYMNSFRRHTSVQEALTHEKQEIRVNIFPHLTRVAKTATNLKVAHLALERVADTINLNRWKELSEIAQSSRWPSVAFSALDLLGQDSSLKKWKQIAELVKYSHANQVLKTEAYQLLLKTDPSSLDLEPDKFLFSHTTRMIELAFMIISDQVSDEMAVQAFNTIKTGMQSGNEPRAIDALRIVASQIERPAMAEEAAELVFPLLQYQVLLYIQEYESGSLTQPVKQLLDKQIEQSSNNEVTIINNLIVLQNWEAILDRLREIYSPTPILDVVIQTLIENNNSDSAIQMAIHIPQSEHIVVQSLLDKQLLDDVVQFCINYESHWGRIFSAAYGVDIVGILLDAERLDLIKFLAEHSKFDHERVLRILEIADSKPLTSSPPESLSPLDLTQTLGDVLEDPDLFLSYAAQAPDWLAGHLADLADADEVSQLLDLTLGDEDFGNRFRDVLSDTANPLHQGGLNLLDQIKNRLRELAADPSNREEAEAMLEEIEGAWG